MRHFNLSILVLFCFGLSACSGSGGGGSEPQVLSDSIERDALESPAPEVQQVLSQVFNDHPSFYEKFSVPAPASISFRVLAHVTDPQGSSDLDLVFVRNTRSGFSWTLYDRFDFELDSCDNTRNTIFDCEFYSSTEFSSIDLNSWELVARDLSGNEVITPFAFRSPNNDADSGFENFVYSEGYGGSLLGGVEALEVLTQIGSNIFVERVPDEALYRISFNVEDNRASAVTFTFHSSSEGHRLIALSRFDYFLPEFGNVATIDILWSDIVLASGFGIGDIDGLHVQITDGPVFLEDAIALDDGAVIEYWFNNLSSSEYVRF